MWCCVARPHSCLIALLIFVAAPPPGQRHDPVLKRGAYQRGGSLEEALPGADAVMACGCRRERMR